MFYSTSGGQAITSSVPVGLQTASAISTSPHPTVPHVTGIYPYVVPPAPAVVLPFLIRDFIVFMCDRDIAVAVPLLDKSVLKNKGNRLLQAEHMTLYHCRRRLIDWGRRDRRDRLPALPLPHGRIDDIRMLFVLSRSPLRLRLPLPSAHACVPHFAVFSPREVAHTASRVGTPVLFLPLEAPSEEQALEGLN